MLSISKLKGPGSDLVAYGENDASAQRRDDYYSEHGQAPCALAGGGWAALGIENYHRDSMIAALEGKDPSTGIQFAKAHPDRVSGFDLTFSAPKSVSAVWAVADGVQTADGAPLREMMDTAHAQAVNRALQHLEEHVVFTRSGKAGEDIQSEPAKLLAAAYTHGSSRAGDPNQHTHVLIANLAQRPNGTFGALDAAPLLRRKMAAGAIYRSEYAAALQAMGFKIERDGTSFKVAGVPTELTQEWSKRRQQVLDELNSNGFRGGEAAEIAALNTRGDKPELSATELQAQWKTDAARHGFDSVRIAGLLLPSVETTASTMPPREEIVAQLTAHDAVFTRDKIYTAIAQAAQGITDADGIEAYFDELTQNGELVQLRDATGRQVDKWTSRELFHMERAAMRAIEKIADAAAHEVPAEILERSFTEFAAKNGYALSDEQNASVRHVCGRGVAIIGAAGAGKSTALAAARTAWEAAGYRVIGCSTAGKAAAGLEESAGIQSSTLAQLLIDLENGKQTLAKNSIVVVDEAGMVDSRGYHALATAAEAAGAKVVLVGDHKQLQAVGAGGLFKNIVDKIGGAELREVRRQREQWGRDLSDRLRNAEVAEGLDLLAERGALHIARDNDAAVASVVEQWRDFVTDDGDLSRTLMVADYNRDVDRLNEAARASMVEDLRIINEIDFQTRDREGKASGTVKIGEGERILFRKNDRHLGVHNGDLGMVARIEYIAADDTHQLTVQLDGGGVVSFKAAEYATLQHGYAVTTHKSQGASIENVVVLGGGNLNSTYVGLTRFRAATHLTVVADTLDRAADLEAPSEKMLEAAQRIAAKRSVDLPAEVSESFAGCREFLLEHGEIQDWQADVRELLKMMGRGANKENTLGYTGDEQSQPATQTQTTNSSELDDELELTHFTGVR